MNSYQEVLYALSPISAIPLYAWGLAIIAILSILELAFIGKPTKKTDWYGWGSANVATALLVAPIIYCSSGLWNDRDLAKALTTPTAYIAAVFPDSDGTPSIRIKIPEIYLEKEEIILGNKVKTTTIIPGSNIYMTLEQANRLKNTGLVLPYTPLLQKP